MENERLDFLVKKHRDEGMDFARLRKHLEVKGFTPEEVKEAFLRFTDNEVGEQLNTTAFKYDRVLAILISFPALVFPWYWSVSFAEPLISNLIWVVSVVFYFSCKKKAEYNFRKEMCEIQREKGRRDDYVEMNHFFDL